MEFVFLHFEFLEAQKYYLILYIRSPTNHLFLCERSP